MTFREIYLQDEYTVEIGVEYAKDLLKAYRPYEKIEKLSGYVYEFNNHFTELVVDSFVNNKITGLSRSEKAFIKLFIDWQNFLLTDPVNPIEAGSAEDTFPSVEKDALIAFNDWLVDKLAEVE